MEAHITTVRVVADLSPEAMQVLTDIRDQLQRVTPKGTGQTDYRGQWAQNVQRLTLLAVLDVLNGWVESAKDNHSAWEHRDEPAGKECWNQYTVSDIRAMIQDASNDIGLTDFRVPGPPQ